MKKLNSKIVLSLLVASQLSVAYAGDSFVDSARDAYNSVDSLKTKHWNDGKVYIDAEAKYAQSFWDPGLSDEDPNNSSHIITYDTEGLGFYQLKLDVGYSGSSIFTYSKLSTITGTQNQEELLAINQSAEGGVDGYTMGFSPEAIVEKLGIDNKYINTALTYRFEITDNAFFGVATAEQNLFYYTNSSYGTPIAKGDIISFKTTFKEQRHTVSSKFLDGVNTVPNSYMRFGLYRSEWTKPTSMGNQSTSGYPAIEMAEYSTTGLTLVYTNYQGTKVNGLNYDMTLDYGFDNSFTSYNSDAGANLAEEESLAYAAVKLDVSYKYMPINTKYQRLSFIFGGSVDWKQWSISDGNEDTEDLKLDAETLYAVYSSVEYRFAY